VLEYIARAVDARRLAVPDAEHAIELRAREGVCLLAAPHGSRAEVFVEALPHLYVVGVEQLFHGGKLLVVSAERRTAIARNETRRIKA
jgi:hypothetical protein